MRYHQSPLLAAALTFIPFALAQVIADLPQCWQYCVNDRNISCSNTDITCICSLSGTDLLSDIFSCVETRCDSSTSPDPDLLLSEFIRACQLAGEPIPQDVIQSAENAGNTVARSGKGGLGITSITTTDGGLVGVIPVTTGGPFTTTLTGKMVNGEGRTYTVAVPEIYDASTTVYGTIITLPGSAASRTGRPTPVPLGGSSSISSTPTSSYTSPSTIPSVSQASSLTSAELSASPLITITTIPSVLLTATTSASLSSTSASISEGNGSPFSIQGAGTKKEARSLLGLTVGLIAGIVWF
ncbi:hypothetical protein MMC06_005130 [Schaereria dolodes]|nr:hypothetical protein [Schaereria dolodes]